MLRRQRLVNDDEVQRTHYEGDDCRPTAGGHVLERLLERWMETTKNDWPTEERLALLADTRKALGGAHGSRR